MNDDDFLNRAIDRVARELTDGSPRRGFAGRVRERLEARPAVVRWRWQLAGAAIAALAALVWFALPRPTAGPIPAARTAAVDRVLPAPPHAASEVRPTPAARQARRVRHTTLSRPPVVVLIPVEVEAAPQIAAIRNPIDLTVRPIEIAELTVAPLEPEKESR